VLRGRFAPKCLFIRSIIEGRVEYFVLAGIIIKTVGKTPLVFLIIYSKYIDGITQ